MYTADSETIGTGHYSFKPEDGGSLFLRNIGVTYIRIGCRNTEDDSLTNLRRENMKNGNVTLCLLAAMLPLRKRVYVLRYFFRLDEISPRTADQLSPIIL